MKRKATALLCLLAALWMGLSPAAAEKEANNSAFHRFLDLSFDTATPDDVEQALLTAYGVGWDPDDTCSLSRGIRMFDHGFNFGIEFNPNEIGFKRIYLCPEDRNIWSGETETFTRMIRRDIADYILLEALISKEYGEPDLRFFRTDGAKFGVDGVARAMFSGGQWDADRMMEQIRADNGTLAYTVWGNVELQYWVIWRAPGLKKSKSCITLYYHDTPWLTEITPDTLQVYPPAEKD